jgi:hypothetical protein
MEEAVQGEGKIMVRFEHMEVVAVKFDCTYRERDINFSKAKAR